MSGPIELRHYRCYITFEISYLSHVGDPPLERDGDDQVALLQRVLPLAKKYDAHGIIALAVRFIKNIWPSDFDLWIKDRKERHLFPNPGMLAS